MRMKPWEMSFNGYFWYEMPGQHEDDKKMNFYLFRVGRLDVEDEKQCDVLAKDGIVEIVDGVRRKPRPRLVSREQKRFGSMGRKPSRKYEGPLNKPLERSAEELQWRAALRLRLCEARALHVAAIPTIAKAAGVGYSQMSKFLREGTGFPQKAVLERVEQCLNDFTTGTLPPPPEPKRGQKKGWRMAVPPGCIPYKEWLESERKKRGGISVHSMRCWLMKNPEEQPPLVKLNARCFFVKISDVQEVAA